MSNTNYRNIMTGKDGRLFVKFEGVSTLLAEVKEFEIKASFGNVEYKPLGTAQQYAIPDKVKFTLSFSEAVVRDDLVMEPLLKSVKKGVIPSYDFQSVALRSADGKEQRLLLNGCVPDGDFDLMTLKSGEIITRHQSFVINQTPEFLKSLPEGASLN